MAKRPPPGRCVHCLATFDVLTWDHGFPVSWYPHGPSAEKPKAPSCVACQQEIERSERAALLPLALGLGPTEAASFGVPQAALRSISPELATTEREREARQRRRDEVLRKLMRPASSEGALPGWRAEDVGSGELALPLSKVDLVVVGKKVARIALWFLREKQFVETSHRLSVHVVDHVTVGGVDALVRRGDSREIAPGARITVRTAADDARTHLLLFELWDRLYFHCSVVPVEHSEPTPT